MSKFKILFNGELEDDIFDTEAEDYASYLLQLYSSRCRNSSLSKSWRL